MANPLKFEESLKALREMFTRTHPSFTMEWVAEEFGQYIVGEFTSHYTDKPNVRFRKLFHNFKEFVAFNEIFDFGDGYETWRLDLLRSN